MDKIRGVNLGNWLVLERWMQPEMFEGTGAEDEVWLNRRMDADALAVRMQRHRDTYIQEADFAFLAEHGINLVRLPVPFFVFGDRAPYQGCIEYVDRAMDWAGRYHLQVLLDLHTVPGSQNGYDNGGITGVCKWCKDPAEVEFSITVLERLAQRYGHRSELYGIEALNEPISTLVYYTAPSTGKAVDKAEAKGSGPVPTRFLEAYYREVYTRLRRILPEDKVIMFHDGFRLGHWGRYFRKEQMRNVVLDTHIYVFAMESFVPIHRPWVYNLYIRQQRGLVERIARDIPVVVGEWCICNRYAEEHRNIETDAEWQIRRRERYQALARTQQEAWNVSAGAIYWSYHLEPHPGDPVDESWKESWDYSRCVRNDWLS